MFLSTIRFNTLTPIGRDQQKKLSQILNNLIDLPQSSQFLHPVPWKQYELDDYLDMIKHPMNLLKVQQKMKNKDYQNVEEVLDHIQLIWENCKTYNPEGYFYQIAQKNQKAFKKMIKNYLPNIQILPFISKQNTPSALIKEKIIPVKKVNNLTVKEQISVKPLSSSTKMIPQKHTSQKNKKYSQIEQSESIQKQESEQEQKLERQVEEVPFIQKNRLYQKLKQITQQQLTQIVMLIQQNSVNGFKSLGGGRYQIVMDNVDLETFKKVNEKVNEFIENQKILNQHTTKKIKI